VSERQHLHAGAEIWGENGVARDELVDAFGGEARQANHAEAAQTLIGQAATENQRDHQTAI
jgi:hypothetical protein